MFERFTHATRQVVLDAVTEAEREQAPEVTPEHLLLALLNGTRSAPVLAEAGITRQALLEAFAATHRQAGLTDADTQALAELGIDVPAIVDTVERTHGPGALAAPRRRHYPMSHIPFAPTAKAVLSGALRQAKERRHRHIGDDHVLLALATTSGPAAQALAAHDLTYPDLRTRLAQAS
ncbi:Clp protease N-terminal domain-containing protein [Actinophytocola gossypii]|uniref:Clp protease n=1 Tax=Actinophytocola gossypii TaxID=2812003 RepID=A0ABT2JCZ8_9PSEU|nr:Clp protease N-terminal domain-containing protein [Actinophytocola gossypii]MCT2585732.1 Clp protease [Actinophytocola gossypii]